MNTNTVCGYKSGVIRDQIPVLSGIGITETIFSVKTDTGIRPAVIAVPLQNAVVGSSASLQSATNSAILVPRLGSASTINGNNAPYYDSGSFDGSPFFLRASGTFTSGVAANDLKIGLYLGSSATIGSDTAISSVSTGTGGAFGVVSGHFLIEAYLLWDSTTARLDGTISGFIATVGGLPIPFPSTQPVYTTQVTAATPANLQFVLSGKWNATNANNVIQIKEFSLEKV